MRLGEDLVDNGDDVDLSGIKAKLDGLRFEDREALRGIVDQAIEVATKDQQRRSN